VEGVVLTHHALRWGEQESQKNAEQNPADDEKEERQRGDGGSPLIGRGVDLLETECAQVQAVKTEQYIQEGTQVNTCTA
jgi:hypothetical protein